MLAEIFQQIEDWKIRTILNANIFLFFFWVSWMSILQNDLLDLDTSKVWILIDWSFS